MFPGLTTTAILTEATTFVNNFDAVMLTFVSIAIGTGILYSIRNLAR